MTFTTKDFRVVTGFSGSQSVHITESDFPGLSLTAPNLPSFEESLAKWVNKFLLDYRGAHSFASFVERDGPTPVYCFRVRLTDTPLYWQTHLN